MYDAFAYDVEPKRKFTSSEAAQVVFTFICLLNSALLCSKDNSNTYQPLMYFLFFGTLIWMVYLILTLVVHVKNKSLRSMMSYLDVFYWLFHFIIFIWVCVSYYRRDEFLEDWDLWVFTYIIFGFIFIACFLCLLLISLVRLINKKMNPQKELYDDEYVELN